uniref:BESS domain-containing protein n=1 Tax=Schizaphis graminum TaxID=13262 RepID=A0A2S2NFG0_SCHGA
MSNVREEIVEDKFNDNETSNRKEQLDGSFSETLQPINPLTSSTSIRTERQKEHTAVSNINKVLEKLNKKQQVTTGSLNTVEMLILSHAKTMKTFSPKRQAIAKHKFQILSEI